MINDHTRLPQIIHQSITQNEDETRLELDIYFHRDLIFFKGHFDNAPILPGIAQTDFVIAFAARFLEIDKKTIANIPQLKFSRVILPESTLKLCISKKPSLLTFRYIDKNNATYSSGKIKL
ncbi:MULTISPECIES: hydroxymyristoyl-ACP dehydratase [Cysteiniphilum]|uniref:ApeI family dehydratase n=1 Tax=Cysteiniphilum TaxID=2056696 RepID=UPI001782403D|nr:MULTISPECIES: hydroxymyristoyl-ACP dehydratase [Cysteiniphilum]